ncbi:Hsp20/alpha crystallin family protein [Rhodococcus sp. BE178]|uniref:Hsp20/alpha crystallin family protein n=1 Tax=Rhodococcus sp. BE178 TaxID=2817737 RepID=UPI003D1CAD2D
MLRFDPFSDIDALTRSLLSNPMGSTRVPRFMPMDLYRVDDHYVLHADLPGVDPGSVDVNIENGTMTLTAHRSAPSEENVQWLASERFSGTYRRQLSLGDDVDVEKVSASYENGVLTVMIPVAERAKPRRIEVTRLGSDTPRTIEAGAGDRTGDT